MSGVTTATVIAGIGAAASVASGISSIMSSAPKASGAAATGEVSNATNQAASARSLLLDTAGGSAGEQLQPGQVGGNKNTTFGN
jgi:hypothetical protein